MSSFILLSLQAEAHNVSEVCFYIYISVSVSLSISMSMSLSTYKVCPFLIANIVLLSRSKAEESECGVTGMDIIAWPMIKSMFCLFHEITCYSSIYFFHKLLPLLKTLSGCLLQKISMWNAARNKFIRWQLWYFQTKFNFKNNILCISGFKIFI